MILLYAWGYSFDWQGKKIVLTGGLYIKSIPKKAAVYLDDKQEKETPVFIKRLLPKYYQVKVTKDGYYDWNKKLKIESKLVTEAKDILLIPINPKIEVVNEKIAENFSLKEYLSLKNAGSNDIFYIQKPSYILYKTDKTNSSLEQISLTPLPNNQEYEIIVSNNQKIALLNDIKELYIFNQATRNFELIKQNVQEAQFSSDNQKLLYYTPNEIWIYYLDNVNDKKTGEHELITRLSQKIEGAVWYKTNQHIIFLVNQEIKIIELDDRDERNIVDIIKIDAQQMAYSEKDQTLYLTKEQKFLRIFLE